MDDPMSDVVSKVCIREASARGASKQKGKLARSLARLLAYLTKINCARGNCARVAAQLAVRASRLFSRDPTKS